MVTDPFSPEAQNAPFGRKKAKLSAAGVIAGVLGVGLVTVLFGFYMPLSAAQEKLKTEYTSLNSSQQATTAQLEKTTQQLVTTQKERDELAGKMGDVEKARASDAERALDINTQVTEKLAALAKGKALTVSRSEDRTVVTLDNDKLFQDRKVSVHRPGRKTLCAVAKALKGPSASSIIQVEAHTRGAKVKDPVLRRDFPTVWELGAARSANAVNMLRRCGLRTQDISAASFADTQPNPKYPKKSSGEIRIVLTPKH